MTSGVSLADLLGAPVRVEQVSVGEVVGLVLDLEAERLLGLEVAAPGGARLFLPWVAARLAGGFVKADSALVLIDLGDVEAYVRLGATIVHDASALASRTVAGDGGLSSPGVSAAAAGGT